MELEFQSLVSGEELPTQERTYWRSTPLGDYQEEETVYDTSADAYFVTLVEPDSFEEHYEDWLEESRQEELAELRRETEKEVLNGQFESTVLEEYTARIDRRYEDKKQEFDRFLLRFEPPNPSSVKFHGVPSYGIHTEELDRIIENAERIRVESEEPGRYRVDMTLEEFADSFEHLDSMLELPSNGEELTLDVAHFSEFRSARPL